MKRLSIYFMALLLVGCESEIPFEYNTIEPIHTIQAEFIIGEPHSVAKVYISQTQDVDSPYEEVAVADAEVEITTPQGEVISLSFDGDSLYVASLMHLPEPNQGDYSISVVIDGQEYSASSELMVPAVVMEPVFYWQDVMMGLGILMMKAMIADPIGEDNYYRYHFLLPDGKVYQDGVISDSSIDGTNIELYAQFNPAESLGFYTLPEEMAGSLYLLDEGETLTICVESLDKRAYDFLSTLGSSTTNPISSFEGGCLGYFSVSTISNLEWCFSGDDIISL